MSIEPRMAIPGAKYTNAIQRILHSRGLEWPRKTGTIQRLAGAGRWRVSSLTKAGVPFPDQEFMMSDGRLIWRDAE